MLTPDLTERIRTIFLQERSFVSIAEAAVLLGWPRGEMRAVVAAGEIELTTACSGAVVGREELIAKAIELWPAEWIEQALGSRAAAVLPEAVRTRRIAARVPRYQAAMLDVLAERQQTTVGHLLTRALVGIVRHVVRSSAHGNQPCDRSRSPRARCGGER